MVPSSFLRTSFTANTSIGLLSSASSNSSNLASVVNDWRLSEASSSGRSFTPNLLGKYSHGRGKRRCRSNRLRTGKSDTILQDLIGELRSIDCLGLIIYCSASQNTHTATEVELERLWKNTESKSRSASDRRRIKDCCAKSCGRPSTRKDDYLKKKNNFDAAYAPHDQEAREAPFAPFPRKRGQDIRSSSVESAIVRLKPDEESQYYLECKARCVIDGEYWPPVFSASRVRSAKRLRVLPDDIFVCTYPKCGTTWIQHILHRLLDKATPKDEEGRLIDMSRFSPMIERMGAEHCENVREVTRPRILKTHFSYDNIPKSSNAKYIYCVRNPKDCLTSYFYHHRNFKLYGWEYDNFNAFYEFFMSGKIGFGDYFHHLKSWLRGISRGKENILLLKYEDMLANPKKAILKIGRFIGEVAVLDVNDPIALEKIVEETKFSSMLNISNTFFPEGRVSVH